VQKKIDTEYATWQQEGTLYEFEINFRPNQKDFSIEEYKAAFAKALDVSQTMAGALVVIEGHNAPDKINAAKKRGSSEAEIKDIRQAAKNLSLERAKAVREAYLTYCKSKGIQADASQFIAVGLGADAPKFAVPATESEWNANRRVVFRIKSVETESTTFGGQ